MKRAAFTALMCAIALLGVGISLSVAGFVYGSVAFWAGSLAAYGQTFLVGIIWWGLRLAVQRAEMTSVPDTEGRRLVSTQTQAMIGGAAGRLLGHAVAGHIGGVVGAQLGYQMGGMERIGPEGDDVKTLDVGFQRVMVAISAGVLMILAAAIGWMTFVNFAILKPGDVIPINGVLGDPKAYPALDQGAFVFAVSALAIYIAMWFSTRDDPDTHNYSGTTNGLMLMALPGSIAVAVAIGLGFFMGTRYAGEIAAITVAVLLALQGMELLINAFKSYNAVEEFDQEPIDLQATPLVPMFSSASIVGVQILLTQTLGLAMGSREEGAEEGAGPGVFARVMPRIVLATLLMLVVVSSLRVVPAGYVAIRERLGQATDEDINNPIGSGLHWTAPWPIDELVLIPTQRVNLVTVGEDTSIDNRRMGASFWSFRHGGEDTEDKFATGDNVDGKWASQMLETFVTVWWRVKDPSLFYRHLSHSDFIDQDNQNNTIARPIYESLVLQAATKAVTHVFAENSLDSLMIAKRGEIENHLKDYVQKFLSSKEIQAGIEVVDVTIKEIHPPMGQGTITTAAGQQFDPAVAFERVVQAKQMMQAKINSAEGNRAGTINIAVGQAAKIRQDAEAYSKERVAAAAGEAARLAGINAEVSGDSTIARNKIFYQALNDVLPATNKIVLDKGVVPPDIIQLNKDGMGLMYRPPPGQ